MGVFYSAEPFKDPSIVANIMSGHHFQKIYLLKSISLLLLLTANVFPHADSMQFSRQLPYTQAM